MIMDANVRVSFFNFIKTSHHKNRLENTWFRLPEVNTGVPNTNLSSLKHRCGN